MPAPDVSDVVDLTLLDLDPQELFDLALSRGLDLFGGAWSPTEGDTEVVLLEVLSEVTAEAVYAINRLPGAQLEILLRLFGLTRDLGGPATATVTFTTTGSGTIPQGTRLQVPVGDGFDPVEFTTDADLAVVGSPSGTGTVGATATEATDLPNGVVAGTTVVVLDALPIVDSAALASTVAGGRGPEDGAAFKTRSSRRLQRLVTTLVQPEHFTAAALERPEVGRAFAVDNYRASTSSTVAGYVTVAVTDALGAALTAPQRAAVAADLDMQAQANLGVEVIDATRTSVNVTATVRVEPGADPATVEAAAEAALAAYLSPATWPWAGVVRRNELIALLEGVEGVAYVDAGHPTTPAGDVALSGIAPLAQPGTLAVTALAQP